LHAFNIEVYIIKSYHYTIILLFPLTR